MQLADKAGGFTLWHYGEGLQNETNYLQWVGIDEPFECDRHNEPIWISNSLYSVRTERICAAATTSLCRQFSFILVSSRRAWLLKGSYAQSSVFPATSTRCHAQARTRA